MKKITKVAALAALSAMFFAGCSNITDGSVESTQNSASEESGKLSIEITAAQNLIDFSNGSGRTILPKAQYVNNFVFYLAIQDIVNKDSGYATVKKVDVVGTEPDADENSKKGFVQTSLAKSNYNLKLYAVKSEDAAGLTDSSSDSDVENVACLVGFASADLRNSDTVSFYLSANSLQKEGSVALSLYKAGDWVDISNYDVSARLEYLKTATVGGVEVKEGATVDGTDKTVDPFSESATENYTVDSQKPGTYNFVLAFTEKTPDSAPANFEPVVFEWSDTIVILPGEPTAKEIGIPCVIDTKPAAPENFAAGYIDAEKSENAGYYQLEFVWDDKSDNERNFQIEYLQVPADVAKDKAKLPASDADWTALVTDSKEVDANTHHVTYGKDSHGEGEQFTGNIVDYSEGSVGRNQQCAIFKAAYGTRYVARIRSVNNVGESDWVYVTVGADIAGNTDTGAKASKGFTSELINRYKIVYSIGAGKFYEEDGTTALDVGKVYFESEDGVYIAETAGTPESGKIALMQPDGKNDFNYDYLVDGTYAGTVEKPVLKVSDSQPWACWSTDGINEYNHKYYDGCKNLNLIALYKLGTVEIVNLNDYIAVVKAGTETLSAVGSDGTYTGKVMTYSQGDTETDDWTVSCKKEGTFYDEVVLKISSTRKDNSSDERTIIGVKQADGSYVLTVPVKELATGLYNARVNAYVGVKTDYPYTDPILLNITD